MSFYKWSVTAATNATADATINWAEGQAPSTVNDSARAVMAALAKWGLDVAGIATGGTSTAYTVTTNQVFASASVLDGRIICIVPHATNGASPTLAIDGLTARAINISTGVAVPTGALLITNPYFVRYVNASTEFILLDHRPVMASLTLTGALAAAGKVSSSSTSAGIGYATGAGSTVTQGTSKSTGVTINAACGAITMHNAALLGFGGTVGFTVTNSAVAATDVIIINFASGATADSYQFHVEAVAAGSFRIKIRNDSGGTLSEAIVINFAVIKAVSS